ncbi:hypothetical protein J437_LFUL013399 [Ladona fulva]|uniref:TRAFD1/XAF1 zinc finger domain-containing protein n=1 Tax=Ladona fulva TaxID=123851 RepID=A0A8K0P4H1_LADFU|nr:hypothetical protein J437_LFUL013399 [Ladona fulva]
MEEESNWCANCRREIPAVNFVMHSMHCSRNITLCHLCQEPVPRSEVDEHHNEFHSHKECDLCGEKMDINQLDKHKIDLCPARKVTCSICEIDLPAADIIDHENYCGSRTERCDECGEYVMLKYQKLHLESNHGFLKLDDEPGPTPSWQNNERATANGLDTVSNHLRYQRKIPNSASGIGLLERNPLFMPSSSSKRTNDMPQVNSVPPPHASKSVFKAGLMNPDKVMMNSNPEDNVRNVAALLGDSLHVKRPSSHLQPSSSHLQEDDLVALPCEFCEALVPANQLILHQTACRPDLARFDGKLGAASLHPLPFSEPPSRSETLHKRSVDSHQIRNNLTLPSFSIASNAREGTYSALDETMIPCEFCHKAFSASKLYEHESACEHAWPGEAIHNGPISSMESQQRKKTSLLRRGVPNPIESQSSKESGSQSFHRSLNYEVPPVLGSCRILSKEDFPTNEVRHNNFPKDTKTKPILHKMDVGQTSFDKEEHYTKAARDHITQEMAKQFTALHRQPGFNSGGQSR